MPVPPDQENLSAAAARPATTLAPSEEQWERVEAIAAELQSFTPEDAMKRIGAMRNEGEALSVLSLVGRWLSLPVEAPPLQTGDVLGGRYTLREQIGEGGMGTVWRATHGVIGNDVAVKMIHPALVTPDLRSRFKGEMEIMGRLEHPGIARILDAGIHPQPDQREIPYYAMELVAGLTLNKWAAEHRADRAAILNLIAEICAAVQHAHDRGIIHRDLKPSNILVRHDGKPVVLDFGIARLARETDDADWQFCGTPRYAAPEQHLGTDRNFRSGESVDVYAMGAILFEVLTGRSLFEFPCEATIAEMARAIVEGHPPRLADVLPDCPPLLDEVVARAVRRDPVDRYYSIAELARALHRLTSSIAFPAAPEPPPWVPAAGELVPGTRWQLAEKLGEGSSGQVWLGTHEQLGHRRVFKFCDTLDKVRALKRELTLYRLLKEQVGRNPHFIPLHEVSLEEPPWYLMMDYVEALDLEAWTDRHPGGAAALDPAIPVEIIAQAAEALQAAHESGILHRDIKPANLLISETEAAIPPEAAGNPSLLVRIADFGIGQIVADELLRAGTRLGFTHTIADQRHISGTLLYIAPEILEGGVATARSDLYSLGVVFWQMLAGNLRSALDPEGWAAAVSDPLLREDLRRCITRAPQKRWSSAGDFAASLRALPARRLAEAQRQAELAQREHTAYRRGVLRAAAIAAVVLLIVSALAGLAWIQRQEAREARARGSLEQASNVLQLGNTAGRRGAGLQLLQEAATIPNAAIAIRRLAAGFLSLTDLEPAAAPSANSAPPASLAPDETARALSPRGTYLATGHNVDGTRGSVKILNAADGQLRATFERAEFPWVPIPEPGLVQFSPDESLLAVAGPQTSLHVLLCNPATASLHSYIFAREGLKCLAWHPGSRIVATGGSDRVIRLWDAYAARDAASAGAGKNDFSLPPALSTPANDVPLDTLSGWRGTVVAIAFHPSGYWMAGLDDAGWLRVWSGFIPEGLPHLPPKDEAAHFAAGQLTGRATLLLETKLDRAGADGHLEFRGDLLVASYPGEAPRGFTLDPGRIFREAWVASAPRDIAWSTDTNASELCVITTTDIHWLQREGLASRAQKRGANPAAVAFDPVKKQWALPTEEEFLYRWLAGARAESTPKADRRKLGSGDTGRVSRFALAMAADGRVAICFAKRLQFFASGDRESAALTVHTGEAGGNFRDLLWDPQGRMATAVYATADGLRAESYATGGGEPAPVGVVTTRSPILISAGDGQHLLGRGTEAGIFRIHAATGHTTSIDTTAAARQDAPMAVSADGNWIAAVADQNVIRLLEVRAGVHYSDLPMPRSATITDLAWHPSGQWLATLSADGFAQIWSLDPWRAWLENQGLNNGF